MPGTEGKEGICIKDASRHGTVHGTAVYSLSHVGIYVDAEAGHELDIAVYRNPVYDIDGAMAFDLAGEQGRLPEDVRLYDHDGPQPHVRAPGPRGLRVARRRRPRRRRPRFVAAARHDYHLQRGSPAIDAGPAPAVPAITVTAPAAGSRWRRGSTQTVAWTPGAPVSGGELGVWLKNAKGRLATGKTVAAAAGRTSCNLAVKVSRPAGAGYTPVVSGRPTAGAGAWAVTAVGRPFRITK